MSEFIESLRDVFGQFGSIRAKRMFGGYGIYRDDVMFGLVADDVLYLKTDEQTVDVFEKKHLVPFEYVRSGKKVKLSYYMAPENLFEDPEQAKTWADQAFEAALRARKPKKRNESKRI